MAMTFFIFLIVDEKVSTIVFTLIIGFLEAYFLIVLYSLFCEMKEKSQLRTNEFNENEYSMEIICWQEIFSFCNINEIIDIILTFLTARNISFLHSDRKIMSNLYIIYFYDMREHSLFHIFSFFSFFFCWWIAKIAVINSENVLLLYNTRNVHMNWEWRSESGG